MFIDHLEFEEHINCTGLMACRRLLSQRCSHPTCSHAPSSASALHWIFPILQPQLSPKTEALGRTYAQLINTAIVNGDNESLSRIIRSAGDINDSSITKWVSAAHHIALNLQKTSHFDSALILIHNGLDLHLQPAGDHVKTPLNEIIRNNTPVSLTMRSSHLFSLFRKLLRDAGISIPEFIAREMQRTALPKQGWTSSNLKTLFELDFQPSELPEVICVVCKDVGTFVTDRPWLSLLEKLRLGVDSEAYIDGILQLRSEEMAMGTYGEEAICVYCKVKMATIDTH